MSRNIKDRARDAIALAAQFDDLPFFYMCSFASCVQLFVICNVFVMKTFYKKFFSNFMPVAVMIFCQCVKNGISALIS